MMKLRIHAPRTCRSRSGAKSISGHDPTRQRFIPKMPVSTTTAASAKSREVIQPSCGPTLSRTINSARAVESEMTVTTSISRRCEMSGSSTRIKNHTVAATTIPAGTLMMKIHCQASFSAMNPPTSGPTDGASIAAQPASSIARPRAVSRKRKNPAVKTHGMMAPPLSLNRARRDQLRKVLREPARDAREGKAGDGDGEQSRRREHTRQSSAERDRDHFGDQVSGLNPAQLIQADVQGARDLRKRRRDDLDVQNRHGVPTHISVKPIQARIGTASEGLAEMRGCADIDIYVIAHMEHKCTWILHTPLDVRNRGVRQQRQLGATPKTAVRNVNSWSAPWIVVSREYRWFLHRLQAARNRIGYEDGVGKTAGFQDFPFHDRVPGAVAGRAGREVDVDRAARFGGRGVEADRPFAGLNVPWTVWRKAPNVKETVELAGSRSMTMFLAMTNEVQSLPRASCENAGAENPVS